MKVAFFGISRDFNSQSGEALQRYMYELYKNLTRMGVDITKEIPCPSKPFSKNGLSLLLYKSLTDFSSYDIIHDLDFKPILPVKKGKAHYIATIHDLIPIKHPEYNVDFKSDFKAILWVEVVSKLGLRLQLSRTDALIAISSLVKQEIIETGYDRVKVYTVNDGIDSRFLGEVTPHNRKKFVVGYLGTFVTRKNVAFAISAFKKADNKHFKLELWGKKSYMYPTLAKIASPDHRIRFMGMAPETNLINTYDSFDAFIFPTLYEGFGLPILEAQARGLPVVVYKYGMIPKEVRKYCFEAESPEHAAQILEELRSNGYNERLRKKATEYARSFTWDKCAKETLEVYKRVLK